MSRAPALIEKENDMYCMRETPAAHIRITAGTSCVHAVVCVGGWQWFVWEAGSDLCGKLAVICVGSWQWFVWAGSGLCGGLAVICVWEGAVICVGDWQ